METREMRDTVVLRRMSILQKQMLQQVAGTAVGVEVELGEGVTYAEEATCVEDSTDPIARSLRTF